MDVEVVVSDSWSSSSSVSKGISSVGLEDVGSVVWLAVSAATRRSATATFSIDPDSGDARRIFTSAGLDGGVSSVSARSILAELTADDDDGDDDNDDGLLISAPASSCWPGMQMLMIGTVEDVSPP